MKKILFIIKKITYAGFILYCFNYVTVNYNIVVPINYFNVLIISILGPCGLIGIVLFQYLFL